MTHPEYLYWALVILVAWPCSLFSRCSGIVALTWAVGQVASMIGLPEPKVQCALYAAACLATFKWARTTWCMAVGAIYVPLFVYEVVWWSGPELYDTWWGVYYLAMAQVALIPLTVDRQAIRNTVEGFRRRRELDDIMRRASAKLRVMLWIW